MNSWRSLNNLTMVTKDIPHDVLVIKTENQQVIKMKLING